jgi:glycosyltransferase involved in cell wall biosynthesis
MELHEALASVLIQDVTDFELIVVNDNSSGNETDRVVRAFSDPRIRYLKNKTNLGGTASLNVGLETAKGEYVAILDDDDVWSDRKKLSKQVAFMKAHPDHVLLGTNMIIVEAKSKKELTRSDAAGDDAKLRAHLFERNPFGHSSVLYKRETTLRAGGYDESLARGKDYDLWFKLGRLGKFAVLSDYSVTYREALPDDARLVARRLRDAKANARVMWRYKRDYPGFWSPYLETLSRIGIFSLLKAFPSLYSLYRKD